MQAATANWRTPCHRVLPQRTPSGGRCSSVADPETSLPVVVLNAAGVPTTNSRNVAEWFGKRHTNVLQSLDNLECSEDFARLNFQPCFVPHPTIPGRQDRTIDMTKDGLVFLIMGFTGRKAAAFKEAYIARFNQMEAELKGIRDHLQPYVLTNCEVTPFVERDFRSIRLHLKLLALLSETTI